MPKTVDPYVDWLGVTDPHRPLTYYSMLGLTAFEDNPESIAAAIKRAVKCIKPYVEGPHMRLAHRTLSELEAARACLLDAGKKARYDHLLRHPKPPAAAAKPAASPAQSADLDDDFGGSQLDLAMLEAGAALSNPTLSPLASYPTKKGLSPAILWSAVAGGVVVVVLLGVVGMMLLGGGKPTEVATAPVPASSPLSTMPDTTPAPPPPRAAGQNVQAPSAPAPAGPMRPMVSASPSPATAVSPAPQVPTVAVMTDSPTTPTPTTPTETVTVRGVEATVAANPFQDCPDVFRLPSIAVEAADGPLRLTKLELPKDARCELAIFNPASDKIRKCSLIKRPGSQPDVANWDVYQAATAGAPAVAADAVNNALPIATFEMQKNEVFFKWLAGSRDEAANELRNCCLKLTVDEQERKVPLRGSQVTAPLTLDLDESIPAIAVEGDWLPHIDLLLMELVKIEGVPVVAAPDGPTNRPSDPAPIEPKSRVGTKQDDLRVILRQQTPRVEIRIRMLFTGDKPSIKLLPVMLDGNNTSLPFTTERINTMLTKIPKEAAETQGRIGALQNEQQSIRQQVDVVNSASVANQVEAAAKAGALGKLQKMFNDAVKKERDAFERLNLLKTRYDSISPLVPLGNQWHKNAKFYFRVFFTVEGRDIDVLTMN